MFRLYYLYVWRLILLIPLVMIFIGENKGFLHSVGSINWGMMMMLFGLSHISNLLILPEEHSTDAGEEVK